MITDIAVERVCFRCPESHWQSEAEYDVVLYVDAVGDTWEFFSFNGVPTPSPYDVDGAPFCPVCHRVVPGRPIARRFIPVPPGAEGRPRRRLRDSDEHHAARKDLPLLSGAPASEGAGSPGR
jgi:hypothetical protein